MATCMQIAELATNHAEGGLSPEERRTFDEHLQGCEACRAYVHQLETVRATLERLPPPAIPPALEQAALAGFDAWAARDTGAERPRARFTRRFALAPSLASAITIALLVAFSRQRFTSPDDLGIAALLGVAALAVAALSGPFTLRLAVATLSAAVAAIWVDTAAAWRPPRVRSASASSWSQRWPSVASRGSVLAGPSGRTDALRSPPAGWPERWRRTPHSSSRATLMARSRISSSFISAECSWQRGWLPRSSGPRAPPPRAREVQHRWAQADPNFTSHWFAANGFGEHSPGGYGVSAAFLVGEPGALRGTGGVRRRLGARAALTVLAGASHRRRGGWHRLPARGGRAARGRPARGGAGAEAERLSQTPRSIRSAARMPSSHASTSVSKVDGESVPSSVRVHRFAPRGFARRMVCVPTLKVAGCTSNSNTGRDAMAGLYARDRDRWKTARRWSGGHRPSGPALRKSAAADENTACPRRDFSDEPPRRRIDTSPGGAP
jgi:predicted anti-sigma-YlaC factor YlaD